MSRVARLRIRRRRVLLRRRVHRVVHGSDVSILAPNCVGGRISELAGNPYRSPTVGLIIDSDSYLEMLSDLPRYLAHEVVEDPERSAQLGFPVGRMGSVELRFMHYATFGDAVERWHERAARVDPDRVAVLWNDLGGTSDDHVARFAALPFPRKLMFAPRPRPGLDFVAVVPAFVDADHLVDLYTEYELLEPVLDAHRLELFR